MEKTLSFEEVRSITQNVLSVKEAGDHAYRFDRFTEAQYAIYGKNYYGGAHCTPTACFDFIYDGSLIKFDFLPISRTSRNYLAFDLYADGVLEYTMLTYLGGEGQTFFSYEFPTRKQRRVQIFFPFSAGVEIHNVRLDGDASFAPVPTEGRMKLLILGDSITHGYDARQPSLAYSTALARYFDAVALNQAVGGYYFNPDMLDENLPFAPDVITVAYGTNDWGIYKQDAERYSARSGAYIDKLCAMYPNAKIFGITPVWRANADKRVECMPFERVYEILEGHYGRQKNVTVIDGRLCVPHITEAYTDGLHPNTVGQSLYAHAVIDAMEKSGVKKK
ncbi:MAG: SGNH/GDSL hydrolase family protein [Clostridia bacterium]|nr:SGNH/GDSL hydrolase family protein [Clostridia bacterium]